MDKIVAPSMALLLLLGVCSAWAGDCSDKSSDRTADMSTDVEEVAERAEANAQDTVESTAEVAGSDS